MSNRIDFPAAFRALTDHDPFPWQEELHTWFQRGDFPSSCAIPTGLGKTAMIPIWLIALASESTEGGAFRFPRRLAYVVNRRTVVDQSTDVVEKIRARLLDPSNEGWAEHEQVLREVAEHLQRLDAFEGPALAISTLRGQLADNDEWRSDPARPAVILGTVDMIGSRLLFGGYRIGFKSQPLHAGFLGQDVLLVHDEAHLEPAFQRLIERIHAEQRREAQLGSEVPWPRLQIMALSATARQNTNHEDAGEGDIGGAFGLTEEELRPPDKLPDEPEKPVEHVWQRLRAKKRLRFHATVAEKNALANRVADLAAKHKNAEAPVLVFLRRLDDLQTVHKALAKKTDRPIVLLTGTMRGRERDDLIQTAEFRRFRGGAESGETVYLLCTSAGEVGIDISADHMVCDLTPMDSMAQRLGRVNRYGSGKARIDVVHLTEFDQKDKLAPACKKALELLKKLPQCSTPDDESGGIEYDASPLALMKALDSPAKSEAFSPEPTILPATDILFDAWAMSTIRQKMPGRPALAPYLHGVAEWEPPRTGVAWREEVEHISGKLLGHYGDEFAEELLDDYPIKPHELLSDSTQRVLAALQKLAKAYPNAPAWLVTKHGPVEVRKLRELADPAATKRPERERPQESIADGIVLLPPHVGGLSPQGTLDGDKGYDAHHPHGYDIADFWLDEQARPRRERVFTDERQPGTREGMTLIRTIDTDPLADEFEAAEEAHEPTNGESTAAVGSDGGGTRGRFWHWYTRLFAAEDATQAATSAVPWGRHIDDVAQRARKLAQALKLPDELKQALMHAARWHDLGKQRELWQRSIGNPNPGQWYAKPGKDPSSLKPWRPRRVTRYRHEFGSLLDVLDPEGRCREEFKQLDAAIQDVILHLIAAHHGYARPHFPPEAIVDPKHSAEDAEAISLRVMQCFARLQRRYGRWGLAYLESLLRAADWAASAEPSPAPTSHEVKA